MYMDRVEDLEDALEAVLELQQDGDSLSVINRFIEKRVDGVVYQMESAISRINELERKLGNALERLYDLENEDSDR